MSDIREATPDDNIRKAETPQEKLDEALFVACGNNQIEQVTYLLEKGAKPTWMHGRHNALRLAVLRCFLHITRVLVEKAGCSIKDDPIIMHMAALGQVKNETLLAYLVAQGANVNQMDAKLGTPLMLSLFAKEPDEQFARWLLKQGADASLQQPTGEQSSAVHKACESCSVDFVRLLLESGPAVKDLLRAKDMRGLTPLMHAADKGKDDIVELLLTQYGVSPNDNADDYTPLFLACQNGHFSTAQLLVDAGADVNVLDKDNRCAPIHLAASNSHLAILKLLVEHGANTDVGDSRGYTPLMMAASEGLVEVTKYLIVQGKADVNVQASKDGSTALHIAALSQQPLSIALLMRAGADPELKDADGLTAVARVQQEGIPRMVNALTHWKTLHDPQSTCAECFMPLKEPKRCSRCKQIWYCSVECQKKNWPGHKSYCSAKK